MVWTVYLLESRITLDEQTTDVKETKTIGTQQSIHHIDEENTLAKSQKRVLFLLRGRPLLYAGPLL